MSVGAGAPMGAPMDADFNKAGSSTHNAEQNGGRPLKSGEQNGGRKPFEKCFYKQSDTGPYKVIVEKKAEKEKEVVNETKDVEKQSKEVEKQTGINKIAVGMLLKQNGFAKEVMDIRKIGRSKVLVYFSEWKEANKLINCRNLALKNFLAYIPKGFITVKGVISGIPEDIDENELRGEIETDKEIVEMFRMFRKVNEKKVKTRKVGVIFRSNKLPEYVRIYSVNTKVEAYVNRAVMCFACLRYGHIAGNCKGRKRCNNCGEAEGENHNIENCGNPTKCVHCKETHKSSDPKCPERSKQETIKKLMAVQNLTYQEARDEFRVETRNGYDLLSNIREFPSIYQSFANVAAKNVKTIPKPKMQPRKLMASTNGNLEDSQKMVSQRTNLNLNNVEEEDFSQTQPKKRKTITAQENNDGDDQQQISVQKHLELRKRWDDRMQVLASQKENYKSVISKCFAVLSNALSSNIEDGHLVVSEVLKEMSKVLGHCDQEVVHQPTNQNGI